MGLTYADIKLINTSEVEMAKRHQIGEDEVKSIQLSMLVDTRAYMMAINETIQAQLELPLVEQRKVQLADSSVAEYHVVGPVTVIFANRKAICTAFVLPGDSEPLLGAIPMEEMDILVHPQRQELIVNPKHPNYAVLKMK